LRLGYRFLDDQIADGEDWGYKNSGVMLHCEDPKNIGLDQGFPASIEAQFLGGNGVDDRPTGNVCTPGMHIKIDDKLITEHVKSGYISLQSESHPIEFKNIEILEFLD